MSNLRQHLEAARRAYVATRYPGDLVADLRRRESTRAIARVVLGVAAAAAVAACVLLVIHLRSTGESKLSDTKLADVTSPAEIDPDDSISLAITSVPSWHDVESAVSIAPTFDSIVPPAWSVVPTMSTLSAVDVTDEGSESTTREAV